MSNILLFYMQKIYCILLVLEDLLEYKTEAGTYFDSIVKYNELFQSDNKYSKY